MIIRLVKGTIIKKLIVLSWVSALNWLTRGVSTSFEKRPDTLCEVVDIEHTNGCHNGVIWAVTQEIWAFL